MKGMEGWLPAVTKEEVVDGGGVSGAKETVVEGGEHIRCLFLYEPLNLRFKDSNFSIFKKKKNYYLEFGPLNFISNNQ